MYESSFSVHQIKLMIQSRPSFSNGRSIRQHADSTLHLGQIASWDDGRRLIINADLEAGGTPIDKLDGPLGLNGRDGRIDVFRHDVSTVQQATSHVFAMSWVAFNHLVCGLET
uniref:Uncharacterized protein n=1 Tax=Strigamia maritima TaxID=126957 RepID=T1JN73_STRMM